MKIRVTSKLKKAYKKMPKFVKEHAEEKEKIFITNPFDPRLDSHKLHGKYKDYWAFSVVGQYGIMVAFTNSNSADFINIGTHDIYR